MRPIIKIFFFSWMGLILFITPLLAEQQGSVSNSEAFKGTQVIMDDFLVNDDSVGSCNQYLPAMACDSSGNFVVTWVDERDATNHNIYAQRFDSTGTPLGSIFIVNEDTLPISQNYPDVAMNRSGNFVITWQDSQSGHIFAQRYSATGDRLGSNFKVLPRYSDAPAVAMDGSDNFVIAWNTTNIWAQRYDSLGNPQGSNFKVSDLDGRFADIAMNGSGDFVIIWQGRSCVPYPYPNYGYCFFDDIYAQIYDASGTPVDTNFKITDYYSYYYYSSAVVMDDSGNFIITWGSGDIYGQRYSTTGTPLGFKLTVNDDAGGAGQANPDIAIDDSGNFIFAWADYRNANWDIYAQRYDSTGSPLDSNFKVNDDVGTAGQDYPAIAMDGSNSFVIAWRDERNHNFDIYIQRYNSAGTPSGCNFKVDDAGTAHQCTTAVAVNNYGDVVVTWEDYRNGSTNPDIYAQRYNYSGIPIGSNIKVDDDTGAAKQRDPAVAINNSGNFIITWEEERKGDLEIYAQRYNSSGLPIGSNFQVNDTDRFGFQYDPAVAMDSSGNFVITWQGAFHVIAQRYNSAGTPLGSNFLMSYEGSHPCIMMDDPGNFVVTWQNGYIYSQRYNSSGSPLDSAFMVSDSGGIYPVVAVDSSGNFVIAWQGASHVFAQRYNSTGTPLGSNFKVDDDTTGANQDRPAIAMDGSGKFVITWQDDRNGSIYIYAQNYNANGTSLRKNYFVPNAFYALNASFAQLYPAVGATNSDIYFTWQDNRRAKGWDIYAKVVDWNWTEVKEDQIAGLPSSFELGQNYPNPFNPTTTIPFTVSGSQFMVHSPTRTSLIIYNILGQKTRTLVDEEKLPGNYSVIWDGKDYSGKEVASGIYFYQMKTKDFTDTKKMVLLR